MEEMKIASNSRLSSNTVHILSERQPVKVLLISTLLFKIDSLFRRLLQLLILF